MYANQANGGGALCGVGPGRLEAAAQVAPPREPEIPAQLKQLSICLDELRDVTGMVESRFAMVVCPEEQPSPSTTSLSPSRTMIGSDLTTLLLNLRDVRDRLMSVVNRAEI